MMKFKKILLVLLSAFLVIPACCLTGCQKSKALQMDAYFKSNVSYDLYNSSSANRYVNLEDITSQKGCPEDQYWSLTFEGLSDMLYGLTIYSVEFDILPNQTVTNFEMSVVVKTLLHGDNTTTGNTKQHTDTVSAPLTSGKLTHVKFEMNDMFNSQDSGMCTIQISVSSSQYFYADGQETGLKFKITNFRVYGEHIL